MKVAHVIHSVSREVGGPAVSVPSICEGLGSLGHDVRLHVIERGDLPSPSSIPHVKLIKHRCVPGGSSLGVSPSMFTALRGEARECDVVHSHGLWLATNLDVYVATRRAPCRVVLSPRGMLQRDALAKSRLAKQITWAAWQKRAAKRADCLHVTAESELASVRSIGLKAPVALIPNGVAIPMLPGRRSAVRRRVLFLGRLDPIKGIESLIEAWCELHAGFPEWEVRIVGPSAGDYGNTLRQLVRSLQLPRLEIASEVYGEEKARELSESEVLVLPSKSENFGMVVAEALAAGVPVVCSKGAPWSGLEAHQCGFWIPQGTAPLIACLREVLSRPPEDLRAAGMRGRVWMTEEYGWKAQAGKLEQVYRWLVDGGRVPSTVFVR